MSLNLCLDCDLLNEDLLWFHNCLGAVGELLGDFCFFSLCILPFMFKWFFVCPLVIASNDSLDFRAYFGHNRKYFTNFCLKFANAFVPKVRLPFLHDSITPEYKCWQFCIVATEQFNVYNIFFHYCKVLSSLKKCKTVGTAGAEQLLLDIQSVSHILTAMLQDTLICMFNVWAFSFFKLKSLQHWFQQKIIRRP